MEVINEDVQMVRDALKDAPEYVKMHFENIVEQHTKESERAEDLQDQVTALEDEESARYNNLSKELDELQDKYDEISGDGMLGALEAVKYWMYRSLVHGKPWSDPVEILRIVENAL